jgi:hypothetical protein
MSIKRATQAVLAHLLADETFTAPLTGGVYAVGVDGVQEISRQSTPAAFDANGELLPCCLIKLETTVPIGPYKTSARQYLILYVYQRGDWDVIDDTIDQAITLLNDQTIPDAAIWSINWDDLVTDLAEDAINANMGYVRFSIILSLVVGS